MTRYVMANRRAGKFREPDKIASRMTLDAALGSISSLSILNDNPLRI